MKTLNKEERELLNNWIENGLIYLIENNNEGCYQIGIRDGKINNPAEDDVIEIEAIEYSNL